MSNYYEILGVQITDSADEINTAYKKLVLNSHPDENPENAEDTTEKFKAINEAYRTLSDPEKRKNMIQKII